MAHGRANIGTLAKAFKAGDPGDYLIVEDRTKPTTWHLQVKKKGTPDHGLMGSAWAALHSGFRGNVYSGPNKGEAIAKLRKLYKAEKMELPAEKSFTVFKSADGSYRWIARSTTAYRDRDKEILPIDTLDRDSQRMTAVKQFGPLRWWHIGDPQPFDIVAPWGPGLDLGDCDYSAQIGTSRVESGTFKNADIAQRIADTADEYELSPGFFHPIDQPQPDGTYTDIRTFERSLVPVKFGRASNLFTGLTVKEFRMDATEQARRFNAAVEQLGLTPDQAQALASGLTKTDKSAETTIDPTTGKMGVAYKDDPWAAVAMAIKAAMMPMEKAPPPMDASAPPDPNAPPELEAGADDEAAEETEYIGDMSVSDFEMLLTQALQAAIQSFGSDISTRMAAMDEAVKGMGYARTKAESTAQAEIAVLKARLAELEGGKPAVVNPEDVEAALKGAPAAPPDPTKPVVPNDPNRPFAAAAAATFPQLYTQNPDGTFGGWMPMPFAPPQSNS